MVESKLDPTVGQTIQQMKRECVLRSEARHGQAGGLKFQLFFVFWFVCVFFAVSRSCLKQMKVLEEQRGSRSVW